jgi:hypothetical protein
MSARRGQGELNVRCDWNGRWSSSSRVSTGDRAQIVEFEFHDRIRNARTFAKFDEGYLRGAVQHGPQYTPWAAHAHPLSLPLHNAMQMAETMDRVPGATIEFHALDEAQPGSLVEHALVCRGVSPVRHRDRLTIGTHFEVIRGGEVRASCWIDREGRIFLVELPDGTRLERGSPITVLSGLA